jgi:hypothetical protein
MKSLGRQDSHVQFPSSNLKFFLLRRVGKVSQKVPACNLFKTNVFPNGDAPKVEKAPSIIITIFYTSSTLSAFDSYRVRQNSRVVYNVVIKGIVQRLTFQLKVGIVHNTF